ncbi:MAG: hypothetical protein ABI042_10710 [Verrucomicrobiota bacterium]
MKKQIASIHETRPSTGKTLLKHTARWLAAAVFTLSIGAANADSNDKFIAGESSTVNGATVSTWARVNGGGKVIWVGLTMPVSLAENMPSPGSGPAGAFAVLNYPAVVQQTTYFNHAEIQANLHGHPTNPNYVNTNRNSEPHFDIHFYNIPVAQVFPIPPGLFFAPVSADRLPVGYAQPEPRSIPQMGRHAALFSEFTAVGPLDATMIAGFLPDASFMHFIEPMISSDFLLARQNFTLPVPTPAVLGRATQYPTECVVLYDKDIDAYHFVFKGFESIQ